MEILKTNRSKKITFNLHGLDCSRCLLWINTGPLAGGWQLAALAGAVLTALSRSRRELVAGAGFEERAAVTTAWCDEGVLQRVVGDGLFVALEGVARPGVLVLIVPQRCGLN